MTLWVLSCTPEKAASLTPGVLCVDSASFFDDGGLAVPCADNDVDGTTELKMTQRMEKTKDSKRPKIPAFISHFPKIERMSTNERSASASSRSKIERKDLLGGRIRGDGTDKLDRNDPA